MDRYRIVSDGEKIKIYGKDLEDLFINSVYGVAKILYEDVDKTVKFIRGAKKIKLESKNKESLLERFLNKVVSLSNEKSKLYPRAKVLKISSTNLVAQLSGVEVENFDKKIKSIEIVKESIKEKEEKLEVIILLN